MTDNRKYDFVLPYTLMLNCPNYKSCYFMHREELVDSNLIISPLSLIMVIYKDNWPYYGVKRKITSSKYFLSLNGN